MDGFISVGYIFDLSEFNYCMGFAYTLNHEKKFSLSLDWMVNDNHWYNFPLLLPFSSLLYIWEFIDIWIQFDQKCNYKYTINNQVPFLRGMLSKQAKWFDFAPDIFQQHLYLKNKDF